MNRGRVYVWTPDERRPLGGYLTKDIVPLSDVDVDAEGRPRLSNRFVRVVNKGMVKVWDPATGRVKYVAIGDALPDANGDLLFEAGRGGGRMDKANVPEVDFCWRYIQASHFGEVNTYYHLHKIAQYVDDLLMELGAPSLPQVVAVVNAHDGVKRRDGERDDEINSERCVAFQGGHYRLPSRRYNLAELHPVSADGELHLGPGRQLLDAGALVELAGCRYRANAAHNAGILYHEYGHHITRHTADFRANRLRSPARQDNRKAALDEAVCDYWAAAMLECPHIWAWHKRHDADYVHPRSLVSRKTMDEFDRSPKADPHANGTIWAAALWDLRTSMKQTIADGGRRADLLVLKSLILIGEDFGAEASVKPVRAARSSYPGALAKLLEADEQLNGGEFRDAILSCFSARKILPLRQPRQAKATAESGTEAHASPAVLKHVPPEEIPASEEILSEETLDASLRALIDRKFSLTAVGDVMLGDRTKKVLKQFGPDYPFRAVLPILTRSDIVLCNLEGPIAKEAQRADRTFSYRVHPRLAASMVKANINVATLANNHLVDCGREGVFETLTALAAAGVHAVGAGVDEPSAHRPIVMQSGAFRVGILGYYWNRRCAATRELPGSAMDTPEHLKADIAALRDIADRVVVTFHWGVPYERTPSEENRTKARLAIDLGADVVIGHHPHVIQPMEIYQGCPIFYSVGNFTFGSGNSCAEGLMVGVRFEPTETLVHVFPLYVKNRDPRVAYQPKVLSGTAGRRMLERLADRPDASGVALSIDRIWGTLRLPWSRVRSAQL